MLTHRVLKATGAQGREAWEGNPQPSISRLVANTALVKCSRIVCPTRVNVIRHYTPYPRKRV